MVEDLVGEQRHLPRIVLKTHSGAEAVE